MGGVNGKHLPVRVVTAIWLKIRWMEGDHAQTVDDCFRNVTDGRHRSYGVGPIVYTNHATWRRLVDLPHHDQPVFPRDTWQHHEHVHDWRNLHESSVRARDWHGMGNLLEPARLRGGIRHHRRLHPI